MPAFLLCTDLDRTLLPNGQPPECAEARCLIRRLASRDDVHLTYVTGRDRGLVNEAIDQYELPIPDWLIADVGSSLYRVTAGRWERSADWDALLEACWHGWNRNDITACLVDIAELTLQQPAKQGPYKLSYYYVSGAPAEMLRQKIQNRFHAAGIAANLIFSTDEEACVGLLDILPAAADKLCALRFLIERNDYSCQYSIFAGDSGNDLEIFASDIPSVIVANAREDVIRQARQSALQAGTMAQLYLAKGGFLGMNGNYGAGLLEGLAHFHPQLISDLSLQ
ncbi:MAG: HAD-IIB family hydrolase [Pseudomonadales bacterium]